MAAKTDGRLEMAAESDGILAIRVYVQFCGISSCIAEMMGRKELHLHICARVDQ